MAADSNYSKNQLTNPGAESGSIAGWSFDGTSIPGDSHVAEGGSVEDSNYCFAINDTFFLGGLLYQILTFPVPPSDIKISADFLPSVDLDKGSTRVLGTIYTELQYANGTKDIVELPCRRDLSIGGD